jgi:hypothetical protein
MHSALVNGVLALANATVGVEINNGKGMPDCSIILSYEQLVIDNDIVGRAIAGCREVPVNKVMSWSLRYGVGSLELSESGRGAVRPREER